MGELLIWVYILNSVLLIVHEMDSAYRKEWVLFGLPGGPDFFMILHIPLAFVILAGIVMILRGNIWGIVMSFIVSAAGIAGFVIHHIFLARGDKSFDSFFSRALLWAMLGVSHVQTLLTVYILL
ncbi:MAG: hypothetical protein A2Y33_07425 [Spirochaetes bacterium GWF1_51_8]|nr:MAG: hypothetical protein A2Y33_07425 [Spirochaetes bacterium GWF1_51_8]